MDFLTRLFDTMLESERMPVERRNVLLHIYKSNGDPQRYSNYTCIKLMSHIMKIWKRVVGASLSREVMISEQQCGFMPRESTTA